MGVRARNFSKFPDPSKKHHQSPNSSKIRVKPPQRCQSKKVLLRECGSDKPKHSRKLAGGAEFRPKRIFFGWVPNQQNRSPTNEMGPSPPAPPPQKKNGHIPGPRDTWGPKQGSLGPHLACNQIWSAAISPRANPKTGRIHFGFFGPFQAPNGVAKFPPESPPEKTPVETPNVVRVRKLHNATAVQPSQKTSENSPLAPSYS